MKNQYETKGEIVEITVPHNKSGEQFIFAIDADDFSIVSAKASWSMDKNKTSAIANFRQDTKMCKTTMHRLLTGWKNVNFADGDLLNLRRSNMVESAKRKRVRAVGQNLKGNEYRISGDTVYIFIDNPNGKGTVLIDREDWEKVQQYTWNINPVNGYAQSRTREGRDNYKSIYMHRLIMCAAKGDSQVDHINRDRLYNKKENLRFATWSENQLNKGVPKNSTTGFRGVYISSSYTFCAHLKMGDTYHKKTFKTFEEAKAQRLAWEQEHGVPPIE